MDQAETLAREICKADGQDPDGIVPVGTSGPEAPDRPVGGAPGDGPRWRLYEAQARRLIALQDGL